jgi:iron complex outermembrane recepter protein
MTLSARHFPPLPCLIKKPSPLWFALALAIPNWALADMGQTEEDLYFTDVPTVFSASRLAQPMSETPGFVTLIDREMIKASGAREIADLMRLVPGFQVTSRNFGTAARVTYHGLSTDDYSPRLQVLIDGRSQYSPLFRGGVNWDLIPVAIEDIERIEVVRGSNVAAYGTNAFMGVVNIITLDASQAQGTTIAAASGTRGIHDEYLRFGGKVNDATFRITYQQQADDGIVGSGGQLNWPNGQNKRFFDFRSDIPLTIDDEIQIGFGKLEGKMQVGRIDNPPDNTDPLRTLTASTEYAQVSWRRALGSGDELNVRLHSTEDRLVDRFTNNLTNTFNGHTEGQPNDTLDYGGIAERRELELAHTVQANAATRIVWGAGTRTETVTSAYNFYAGSASRNVNRAFSHLEWRPSSAWLINLGGSSDTDTDTGHHFSPRASVSYHLNEAHTLRAGITRSYRLPSLYEYSGYQYYGATGVTPGQQTNFIADGKVQAEELLSREIGYFGEFKAWHASLDIRAFDERIPNLIQIVKKSTTDPSPDYATNAIDVHITGVEYQVRWEPQESTRITFGQTVSQILAEQISFQTGYDAGEITKISQQTEASMPRTSSNLMLMQKLPQALQLSIMVAQQDDIRWTRNSNTLIGYTRVDWRLAKPFKVGTKRGEVAYVVQCESGDHKELIPDSTVGNRQWLTLRLDL